MYCIESEISEISDATLAELTVVKYLIQPLKLFCRQFEGLSKKEIFQITTLSNFFVI